MSLLKEVERYYDAKVLRHGPTAGGVDWNSSASQTLRFEQLLKIIDRSSFFTINDYGCGYGALADHLAGKRRSFGYRGFDISARMISSAKQLHGGLKRLRFFTDGSSLAPADYTVSSGIFNVKLKTPEKEWREYACRTLRHMDKLSIKGFAFNFLTVYSDKERRRRDLYYADPRFYFDFCKKNFSRDVALLHDYGLYEFTMLVRKHGAG